MIVCMLIMERYWMSFLHLCNSRLYILGALPTISYKKPTSFCVAIFLVPANSSLPVLQ